MTLNIKNYDEVKIALELMEGKSIANATGSLSLNDAFKAFENKNQDLCGSSVAIIYGLGGIHRYFVRKDGTIHFSKYHMGFKDVTKDAESLGFIVS